MTGARAAHGTTTSPGTHGAGARLCAAPLAQLRWPNEETSAAGNIAVMIFQTVP
ncbi:DUF7134 domain-containing protein, partial [Streptomyces calvus]